MLSTPARRALPAALVIALAAAGCGSSSSSSKSAAKPATKPPAVRTTTAATTQAAPASGASGVVVTPSKDLTSKPKVPAQSGPPPSALVISDVVKGTGPAARPGDQVTVQYVGAHFRTGKQFDASWDRGQPFTFGLGAGQVIPGWDRGIVGMRVGGRRQLTIPPQLGYGASGTPDGSIAPNETLVFVVDLRKVAH